MMSWVILILVGLSVIFGSITGNMSEVSNAAISGSFDAVQLSITLLGGMCLWSGVMNIAEKSGLANHISRAIYPITKRLFPGLKAGSKALGAITMNITANLLGLGNAATPLGLMAMKQLAETECCDETATPNMVTFVVLNTASITLIPTTVATLRLANGSHKPLDILPAVWAASIIALTMSILMSKILSKIFYKRNKKSDTKRRRIKAV